MTVSSWIFETLPYLAVIVASVFAIIRFKYRAFSVSSLSSQFLEGRLLFWGSVPWHYGVLVVLAGHMLAFLAPQTLLLFNAKLSRLYLLEVTGMAFSILAVFGLFILLWRRLFNKRIRAVTSKMDTLVLLLLLFQVLTGLCTAILYRWGSSWFAATVSPYLWSLFSLHPESNRLQPMPILIKIHFTGAFLLIALLPFSRLIHALSVPVHYLFRPPQLVIWNRKSRKEFFNGE